MDSKKKVFKGLNYLVSDNITPVLARRFYFILRVSMPLIIIYKLVLDYIHILDVNNLSNNIDFNRLSLIIFLFILELIIYVRLEKITANKIKVHKNLNSIEKLFKFIALTYAIDVFLLYNAYILLQKELNIILHLLFALAVCHSFLFPSYIYYKGKHDWHKKYTWRHFFSGGAIVSTILIPFIYFKARFLVDNLYIINIYFEVSILVFTSTLLRLELSAKNTEIRKSQIESDRRAKIRETRENILASLPSIIQFIPDNTGNKSILNYATVAKFIGEKLQVEYCAIGNVEQDYLVDNDPWILNSSQENLLAFNKVRNCPLEGSFIGEAFKEGFEDKGIKAIINGDNNLIINTKHLYIYANEILPTRTYYSCLVVGLFEYNENNVRNPIGYIHLINKLIHDNNIIKIDETGFNEEDLTTVVLIAKQIGLFESNTRLKQNDIELRQLNNDLRLSNDKSNQLYEDSERQNADQRIINDLMIEKNTEQLFSNILHYINYSFNCRFASFWFPVWNGYQAIEDKSQHLKFKSDDKPTELDNLKVILRKIEINTKLVDIETHKLYNLKKVLMSQKGFNAEDNFVGKILLDKFIDFIPDETNDIPILTDYLDENGKSCFQGTYKVIGANKYLIFPVFRVDYLKEKDREVHPTKYAEHIFGIFYLKLNSSEFEGEDKFTKKRLSNFSRNLSILFDKILFEKRYSQIDLLKNSLYKLPISDSQNFHKQIVKVIKEIVNCEICSLFLHIPASKGLKLIATTANRVQINKKDIHKSDDYLNKEIYKYNSHRSFTYNVLNRINSCINFDESSINNFSDHVFIEETAEISSTGHFYHKSYLAVPLINYETGYVSGVIRCINKSDDSNLFTAFTQSDSEFLLLLSGIITRFIDFVRWNENKLHVSEVFAHDFKIPLNELKSVNSKTQSLIRANKLKEAIASLDNNAQIEKMLLLQIEDYISNVFGSDFHLNEQMSDIFPQLLDVRDDLKAIVRLMKIDWSFNNATTIISHDKFLADKKVFVDKRSFSVIFFNLLKNAVRYSYKGQSARDIDIFYKREEINFPDTSIYVWDTFEVQNYGIGIRQEEVKYLFMKGFRGHDAETYAKLGTGYGLFTVCEILKAHHGKIKVERLSNPTVFKVFLPVYEQSPLKTN